MLLPVATTLILLGSDGLYLLAEGCLAGQILLLFGADAFEVLLVALVDNGGGCLEAVPYLVAQVLADGTDLTVFGMELLQLVEGTDDIGLIGQLLCGFAEFCL